MLTPIGVRRFINWNEGHYSPSMTGDSDQAAFFERSMELDVSSIQRPLRMVGKESLSDFLWWIVNFGVRRRSEVE